MAHFVILIPEKKVFSLISHDPSRGVSFGVCDAFPSFIAGGFRTRPSTRAMLVFILIPYSSIRYFPLIRWLSAAYRYILRDTGIRKNSQRKTFERENVTSYRRISKVTAVFTFSSGVGGGGGGGGGRM